MENQYLENLRAIAFTLHIKPKNRADQAVAVGLLAEMLLLLQESYTQFLTVTNNKRKGIINTQVTKPEVSSDLMMVDVNFQGFKASIAPDYVGTKAKGASSMDFPLPVLKELFTAFVQEILAVDYTNSHAVLELAERFTTEERKRIFGPLFKTIQKSEGYEILVNAPENDKTFALTRIPQSAVQELTPSKDKPKVIRPKKVRQPIVAPPLPAGVEQEPEVLLEESAPAYAIVLVTKVTVAGEPPIVLKRPLEVRVDVEDGVYLMAYPDLEIEVSGSSQEEAEKAFHFAFYSLYEHTGMEYDENLTDSAKQIKKGILSLIK
ncbi:hypothetical protein TH61_12655 [Rufibacter sp. DG15C]|uniref:hypothetical protein n=1 Tax=Rufibacter sp. DG15C TaxID=1379909 RepID=UPI00078D8557|nr:hypothetical protein [Rufibacter sp. DG15C]AMM51857.1 hypothetical protein TH61_12655 [Rufibacter sp. DG15C]